MKKVKEKELIKLLDEMYMHRTMLSYCLKHKENTGNINRRVSKTSNNKTMFLSKSKFLKKQRASGILSSSVLIR